MLAAHSAERDDLRPRSSTASRRNASGSDVAGIDATRRRSRIARVAAVRTKAMTGSVSSRGSSQPGRLDAGRRRRRIAEGGQHVGNPVGAARAQRTARGGADGGVDVSQELHGGLQRSFGRRVSEDVEAGRPHLSVGIAERALAQVGGERVRRRDEFRERAPTDLGGIIREELLEPASGPFVCHARGCGRSDARVLVVDQPGPRGEDRRLVDRPNGDEATDGVGVVETSRELTGQRSELRCELERGPARPDVVGPHPVREHPARVGIEVERDGRPRAGSLEDLWSRGQQRPQHGVHERSVDHPRRGKRQERGDQPDHRELSAGENVLSDERDDARDRGPDLRRTAVQESPGLVPPVFRNHVDERLPRRGGDALEPHAGDHAQRHHCDEPRRDEQDRERPQVEQGQHEHHRGGAEAGEELIRQQDRDQEGAARDRRTHDAEEAGERVGIREALGRHGRERQEQGVEEDREQHRGGSHPEQQPAATDVGGAAPDVVEERPVTPAPRWPAPARPDRAPCDTSPRRRRAGPPTRAAGSPRR